MKPGAEEWAFTPADCGSAGARVGLPNTLTFCNSNKGVPPESPLSGGPEGRNRSQKGRIEIAGNSVGSDAEAALFALQSLSGIGQDWRPYVLPCLPSTPGNA